jgi:thiosulfate/3-mercaptopyruvate sulfurtransferase
MRLSSPDKVIVSPDEVLALLKQPDVIIVDCTFQLAEPDLGEKLYREAHIPGAVYAHLDRDLSGPVIPGHTGRHPVPHPVKLARTFTEMGIGNDSIIVSYDQGNGAYAARLWWLLRYLGHDQSCILDGGLGLWKERRLALERDSKNRSVQKNNFAPFVREWMLAEMQEIRQKQGSDWILIDVRAPERYTGEQEPIDPVAGHIPGAVNVPYASNLVDGKSWKPAAELRAIYKEISDKQELKTPVFYCGSGVTACHGIVAYVQAGYGMPVLYGGSWSEWITDPSNPVATA